MILQCIISILTLMVALLCFLLVGITEGALFLILTQLGWISYHVKKP